MKNTLLLIGLVAGLSITGCKKEEDDDTGTPPLNNGGYSTGAYVVNEGAFLQNNASITHVGNDGTVTNDVFFAANGVELGDVLQSFTVIGDRGYAVLNNSQRITIVDLKTMDYITAIEGLSYPRYMVQAAAGKAYVSNGSMDGTLEIIDLNSAAITGSIAVGKGPGKLAALSNEVWVCNEGGWMLDSTITVINGQTNELTDVIEVGHRPSDLVFDSFGYAWVLCAGETYYDANFAVIGHSPAQLFRIDVNTREVVSQIQVGLIGDHPRNLEISPDQSILYYELNGIYALDLVNGDFPGDLIVSEPRTGLSVHPFTGEIWCAGISDFINPSTVYTYSETGITIGAFQAGIGTNGIVFK